MKTYKIYIISVMLLTSIQACNNQAEPTGAEQQLTSSSEGLALSAQQITKIGLESQTISQRTVTTSVAANGILDVPTQHMASVTTFLGSYVKLADKHVGERVKKGEVLAVMEGPEFVDLQQQYLEHKSQLSLLSSDLDRQTNLAADSITSTKSLQQARSIYEQTASMLAALKQKLSYLHVNMSVLDNGDIARSYRVLAPIDGYLTKVTGKIGAFTSPGESLMEIVDLTHIHAELSVYESDAMAVKEGQKMLVTLPSMPGKVLVADIYLIDKTFDDNTRSVKAHGHFEEENIPFIIGMYVEGKIITGESTGYAVPGSAAVFADNNRFIFLEKKEGDIASFKPINITEAVEMDGWVVIDESEMAGGYNKVVTKGAGYLLSQWMMAE